MVKTLAICDGPDHTGRMVAFITDGQFKRKYGDYNVFVQFDDAVIPWLSALSGSCRSAPLSLLDRHDSNIGGVVCTSPMHEVVCDECKRGFSFIVTIVKLGTLMLSVISRV
jgi:hypothetical protein